jgi:hypothetical protein
MNIQPKFGAILVKELSFKQGHSQHPETVVRLQVTGDDRKRFEPLLDQSDLGKSQGDIRLVNCDIQSGGLDRKFSVNYKNLAASRSFDGLNRPERALFKLTRELISKAPLTEDVKATLIQKLEDKAYRTGPTGRKVPMQVATSVRRTYTI